MNIFDNISEDCIFDIPHKNKIILAKILSVYDGDTCICLFELKNGVFFQTKLRIYGVDTPELHSKNKNIYTCELEKKAAENITQKIKNLIEGKILKIRILDYDKYGGRFVGEIFLSKADKPRNSSSLSKYLIKKGYGKEYFGEKKNEWTNEELLFIIDS